MTRSILAGYRNRLLTLARRLQGEASGLAHDALRKTGGEENGDLSSVPQHLADLATDYSQQEVAILLLENGHQTLDEIDDALMRIEEGAFGRCEECKNRIPDARLQVVPYTRHCVRCAQKVEKGMVGGRRLF